MDRRRRNRMWEEKTPRPECEFCWMEASSFLVVWGAREEQFLTRCPVLAWSSPGCSWHRDQPFLWCRPSRFCGDDQLFLWCSAQPFQWCSDQCSPSGALVQLGGVLALHIRHVVLRGLLPIVKEQLLGLPITLTLDRAHRT